MLAYSDREQSCPHTRTRGSLERVKEKGIGRSTFVTMGNGVVTVLYVTHVRVVRT